jgi:hypothetical protein
MNTAKKVAPKAVPKKQGIKASVVDSKKIVHAKTKKVVPKLKKTVPKSKQISIKNKAKEQTIEQNDITFHSKKMNTKFDTLEALHTKNQVQTFKLGLPTEKRIALRPIFNLLRLSSQRFPVDIEIQAIKTARYGGMFFVVIGAIFTLFFANGAFSTDTQLASVSGGIAEIATSSSAEDSAVIQVNCQDPLLFQSLACRDRVDTSPEVQFEIIDRTKDQKGTVKVTVHVPYAQRVKLFALHKNDGASFTLGLMNSVAADSWEFYWNTTTVDDGIFRLRVLVQNAHGSYEKIDSSNVTIENIPFENPNTFISPNDSMGSTTTQILATDEAVVHSTLVANVLESQNEFRFEIKDTNADSVKLYAFHTQTAKKIFLGTMYASLNDTWKYRWLSVSMQDGEYKIIAQIVTDGVPTYSSELIVKKLVSADTQETAVTTQPSLSSETTLNPEISIRLPLKSPLSGFTPLQIDVENAALVEFYAQGQKSLVRKYLGIATMLDVNTWTYRFDTNLLPDGEYSLIAVVKNMYGAYEQKISSVLISNKTPVTYTSTETDHIKALQIVGEEVQTSTSPVLESIVKSGEDKTVVEADAVFTQPQRLLKAVQQETIASELKMLANALRLKDEKSSNEIKARILSIKATLHEVDTAENVSNEQIQTALDSYIRGLILRTEEDVFATDKLIAERTKEKANEDTDTDGVSNYDEVVIYQTNPYTPDSDNDGFNDGAEILSGYDPTNAKPEALVTYESPKESGIVREDILEVTSITTELKDEDASLVNTSRPVALISGSALPNSFITLYIYSTPIVVTIKTDPDGGWNYRFDKELEDGEHQVYIGVTDNAGKIVAKSNSFGFVKTAEAFTLSTTGEEAKPEPVVVNQNSFLSDYMVYLVLSISTVAIGLVLILLGLHLDSRQRKFEAVTKQQEALV